MLFSTMSAADEFNPDHLDRNVQPGVSHGKIKTGVYEDSKIFPGTRRDYSVYIPAQYTGDTPACLMVFPDSR